MPPEILQFLNANASAVFGLLGALGGGVLSFVAALLLKQRDFRLQIRSKIVDRQIAAHERILQLAQDLRTMGSLGTLDTDEEISRGPIILLSKNAFEDWFTLFTEQQLAGSTWLTTGTKREVAFVQDYLGTLHMHLVDVPSKKILRSSAIDSPRLH
jgi:hypothetical protein